MNFHFDKVTALLSAHIDFLKKAFSDNGNPSSSRLLGAFSTIAAVFCLLFVTIKNHVVPGADVTGGLAAFGTAHYAVNRATSAWGKNPQMPKDGNGNGGPGPGSIGA